MAPRRSGPRARPRHRDHASPAGRNADARERRLIERKTRLDGTTEEFDCEPLLIETNRRAILKYVLDREWRIADRALVVPKGTITVSHYWSDRSYNVYHWITGGRSLAYYCNVVEGTEIRPDLVAYTDLAVDVLILPSGDASVLDEEELPPDLAPERRKIIARTVEELTSGPRRLVSAIEKESRRVLPAG